MKQNTHKEPPRLIKQRASRSSWPPDSEHSWTYIHHNPYELCKILNILGITVSQEEIRTFFIEQKYHPIYGLYYNTHLR